MKEKKEEQSQWEVSSGHLKKEPSCSCQEGDSGRYRQKELPKKNWYNNRTRAKWCQRIKTIEETKTTTNRIWTQEAVFFYKKNVCVIPKIESQKTNCAGH